MITDSSLFAFEHVSRLELLELLAAIGMLTRRTTVLYRTLPYPLQNDSGYARTFQVLPPLSAVSNLTRPDYRTLPYSRR